MIPKIIHYCWFGRGEKSQLAKKCIQSWRKFFPDYKIIEWNEDNFDINYNEYTQYCYRNKKWAYLSDLVRLLVVETYGGIYFDTDVEVIRTFDSILDCCNAFFCFENESNVNTGLGFGAIAHHPTVQEMIKYYDSDQTKKGEILLVNCPALNTAALKKMGLELTGHMQKINGTIILPIEYMNPYDDPTGHLNKTENTLSIHWYSKSAFSIQKRWRTRIMRPIRRIFEKNCLKWMRKK